MMISGGFSAGIPETGFALRFSSLSRTRAITLGDAFCVLVPLLQVVKFDLIGEMCLSDFLITMALPIAVWRHSERLRQKPVSAILSLGLLWLISQIITDLLRGSPPEDYFRGWCKIFLLLANFTVVWIVACRSLRRFVLYGTGLTVGLILQFYANPSAQAQIAPWKFALGVPVTLLAMMIISFAAKGNFLGIIVPVTALTVLHAFEDVRSLAVVTFLAAIFTIFHLSSSRAQRGFLSARVGFLTIVIACGLWGFIQVYSHYAEQGIFGGYAQRKLAAQTSGTGGLLLGGRSEILGSSQAILDSPLLGHGSWPRDPIYSAILDQRRKELGFKDVDPNSGPRDDLIPTHSYLFGAWVEAGIGGALFWLFFLCFIIRTFLQVSGSEPLLLLFAFGGFQMVWDTFFSPLGMPTRFLAPFLMAAIVQLSTLRVSFKETW